MNSDGSKLRPWDNTEEMDEALVENHNKVVGPKDTVYHIGDVVINRRALQTLSRLNGEKILIKGNHDNFRLGEYTAFFKDIKGVGELAGFVLTHIPIHPSQVGRWKGNFHGHLHSNRVMKPTGYYQPEKMIDERYLCLCVEQTNFTPIRLEDAKKRFEEQQ